MRQRLIPFVILGIIVFALCQWNLSARKIDALESFNDFWLDFVVGNAGSVVDDPAITVVRINDEYEPLNIGGESSSDDGRLSRLDFATILGFVAKLNPKTVAFLPIPTFDESLVLNQTDVVPLKDAAMQLPKLALAANVSNDGDAAKESAPLDFPSLEVAGTPGDLLSFTRTVSRPDPQLLANGDPAMKLIESSRDLLGSETLRIPLVALYRGKVVPSIALTAVAKHAGVPLDAIVVDLSGGNPEIRLGDFRTIPIASDGTFAVPAKAGIKRTMRSISKGKDGELREKLHFTTLTVDELAYTGGKDDEVAQRIVAKLRAKFDSVTENLVVIGFDRNADRRFTNVNGDVLSETLIFAEAMAVIQSGRFIDWWPIWGRVAALLVIFGIAAFLFRYPGPAFIPRWAAAFFVFFGAVVLLFRLTLSWSPPLFALTLFVLMLVIALLIPAKPKVSDADA